MSYLQKTYMSNNMYLKNPISSFDINRIGLNDNKIDSFLQEILQYDGSIEQELLDREEEMERYRRNLENNQFMNVFIERLKKEKLKEQKILDDKIKEQLKKQEAIDTQVEKKKRAPYNTKRRILEAMNEPPTSIKQDLVAVEGDGILDYIKGKFKKGVKNIKSLGKLVFIKYWKDLAILLFRIARGENIKSDDLLFVRKMVNDGLLNPANDNFRKLTSFFGEKLILKLKQLLISHNKGGMLLKYPSKQYMLKYPSKNIIY